MECRHKMEFTRIQLLALHFLHHTKKRQFFGISEGVSPTLRFLREGVLSIAAA
jgi:hypothetical protein